MTRALRFAACLNPFFWPAAKSRSVLIAQTVGSFVYVLGLSALILLIGSIKF